MTKRPAREPLPIPDADLFRAFDAIAAVLRNHHDEARGYVAAMHPSAAHLLATAFRSVLTELDTIHGGDR